MSKIFNGVEYRRIKAYWTAGHWKDWQSYHTENPVPVLQSTESPIINRGDPGYHEFLGSIHKTDGNRFEFWSPGSIQSLISIRTTKEIFDSLVDGRTYSIAFTASRPHELLEITEHIVAPSNDDWDGSPYT